MSSKYTFVGPVTVPTPVDDEDAANKAFVLANGGGGGAPATHAASHATGGSDPLTPASINAARIPYVYDDFTAKANGNVAGMTAATGQTWYYSGTQPTVASGAWTVARPNLVGYACIDAAVNLTTVGAEFAFGASTTAGGAFGLILFDSTFTSVLTFHTACHLVLAQSGWSYWTKANVDSSIVLVASGGYQFTLPADTYVRAQVVLDPQRSRAYLALPDGSVATVAHASIGNAYTETGSKTACWEPYATATTDAPITVTRTWADRVDVASPPLSGAVSLPYLSQVVAATNTAIAAKASSTDTRLGVKPYPPVALTEAATIATNATLGTHFRATLTADRTLGIPTGGVDGQVCTWEIVASGGARTLTLTTAGAGAFKLSTSVTAITATTSGTHDFIQAVYHATRNLWLVIAYSKGA